MKCQMCGKEVEQLYRCYFLEEDAIKPSTLNVCEFCVPEEQVDDAQKVVINKKWIPILQIINKKNQRVEHEVVVVDTPYEKIKTLRESVEKLNDGKYRCVLTEKEIECESDTRDSDKKVS
jgi:hypothetical protein